MWQYFEVKKGNGEMRKNKRKERRKRMGCSLRSSAESLSLCLFHPHSGIGSSLMSRGTPPISNWVSVDNRIQKRSYHVFNRRLFHAP